MEPDSTLIGSYKSTLNEIFNLHKPGSVEKLTKLYQLSKSTDQHFYLLVKFCRELRRLARLHSIPLELNIDIITILSSEDVAIKQLLSDQDLVLAQVLKYACPAFYGEKVDSECILNLVKILGTCEKQSVRNEISTVVASLMENICITFEDLHQLGITNEARLLLTSGFVKPSKNINIYEPFQNNNLVNFNGNNNTSGGGSGTHQPCLIREQIRTSTRYRQTRADEHDSFLSQSVNSRNRNDNHTQAQASSRIPNTCLEEGDSSLYIGRDPYDESKHLLKILNERSLQAKEKKWLLSKFFKLGGHVYYTNPRLRFTIGHRGLYEKTNYNLIQIFQKQSEKQMLCKMSVMKLFSCLDESKEEGLIPQAEMFYKYTFDPDQINNIRLCALRTLVHCIELDVGIMKESGTTERRHEIVNNYRYHSNSLFSDIAFKIIEITNQETKDYEAQFPKDFKQLISGCDIGGRAFKYVKMQAQRWDRCSELFTSAIIEKLVGVIKDNIVHNKYLDTSLNCCEVINACLDHDDYYDENDEAGGADDDGVGRDVGNITKVKDATIILVTYNDILSHVKASTSADLLNHILTSVLVILDKERTINIKANNQNSKFTDTLLTKIMKNVVKLYIEREFPIGNRPIAILICAILSESFEIPYIDEFSSTTLEYMEVNWLPHANGMNGNVQYEHNLPKAVATIYVGSIKHLKISAHNPRIIELLFNIINGCRSSDPRASYLAAKALYYAPDCRNKLDQTQFLQLQLLVKANRMDDVLLFASLTYIACLNSISEIESDEPLDESQLEILPYIFSQELDDLFDEEHLSPTRLELGLRILESQVNKRVQLSVTLFQICNSIIESGFEPGTQRVLEILTNYVKHGSDYKLPPGTVNALETVIRDSPRSSDIGSAVYNLYKLIINGGEQVPPIVIEFLINALFNSDSVEKTKNILKYLLGADTNQDLSNYAFNVLEMERAIQNLVLTQNNNVTKQNIFKFILNWIQNHNMPISKTNLSRLKGKISDTQLIELLLKLASLPRVPQQQVVISNDIIIGCFTSAPHDITCLPRRLLLLKLLLKNSQIIPNEVVSCLEKNLTDGNLPKSKDLVETYLRLLVQQKQGQVNSAELLDNILRRVNRILSSTEDTDLEIIDCTENDNDWLDPVISSIISLLNSNPGIKPNLCLIKEIFIKAMKHEGNQRIGGLSQLLKLVEPNNSNELDVSIAALQFKVSDVSDLFQILNGIIEVKNTEYPMICKLLKHILLSDSVIYTDEAEKTQVKYQLELFQILNENDDVFCTKFLSTLASSCTHRIGGVHWERIYNMLRSRDAKISQMAMNVFDEISKYLATNNIEFPIPGYVYNTLTKLKSGEEHDPFNQERNNAHHVSVANVQTKLKFIQLVTDTTDQSGFDMTRENIIFCITHLTEIMLSTASLPDKALSTVLKILLLHKPNFKDAEFVQLVAEFYSNCILFGHCELNQLMINYIEHCLIINKQSNKYLVLNAYVTCMYIILSQEDEDGSENENQILKLNMLGMIIESILKQFLIESTIEQLIQFLQLILLQRESGYDVEDGLSQNVKDMLINCKNHDLPIISYLATRCLKHEHTINVWTDQDILHDFVRYLNLEQSEEFQLILEWHLLKSKHEENFTLLIVSLWIQMYKYNLTYQAVLEALKIMDQSPSQTTMQILSTYGSLAFSKLKHKCFMELFITRNATTNIYQPIVQKLSLNYIQSLPFQKCMKIFQYLGSTNHHNDDRGDNTQNTNDNELTCWSPQNMITNILDLLTKYPMTETHLDMILDKLKNTTSDATNIYSLHKAIQVKILKGEVYSIHSTETRNAAKLEEVLSELLPDLCQFDSTYELLSSLNFKQENNKCEIITQVFSNLLPLLEIKDSSYNLKLRLTVQLYSLIKSKPSTTWIETTNKFVIQSNFNCKHEIRDATEYYEAFMKENKECAWLNDDENYFKMLIRKIATGDVLLNYYPLSKKVKNKKVHEMNQNDLLLWAANIKKKLLQEKDTSTSPREYILEILAVLKHGIKLWSNRELSWLQITSIVIAAKTYTCSSKSWKKKGVLQQIVTGGGKSAIIAIVAGFHALLGNQVEIITSSSTLAIRDTNAYKDFYKLFGLNCAHNTDTTNTYIKGMKSCYDINKVDIIYGEAVQYQFDVLRTEYSDLGTLGQRQLKTIVLIDEVDTMMIDETYKVARLASSTAGNIYLQPIYHFVWNELSTLAKRVISIRGQDYIYFGADRIQLETYVKEHDASSSSSSSSSSLSVPPELGIAIGNDITLQDYITNHLQNYLKSLLSTTELNPEGYHIHSDNKLKVPKCLEEFITLQIPSWVSSAITALNYNENEEYIIENRLVKPVDFDSTGQILSSTNWANALHQFLQISTKLPVRSETSTTNFYSNVSFFNRYSHIYGFTGTIGSNKSQELLSEVYNVSIMILPPVHQNHYVQLPDSFYCNYSDWLTKIISCTISEIKRNRGVLIICKTIKIALGISQKLKNCHDINPNQIKEYTKNNWNEEVLIENIYPKNVIVATNLAGRGTHINASAIEEFGGLHVILTFLPETERVELQGFGRTARQGNIGTGQLVAINPYPYLDILPSSIEIRNERHRLESQKLDHIKNIELHQIKIKQLLLSNFCDLLKYVRGTTRQEESNWRNIITHPPSIYEINYIAFAESKWANFIKSIENCNNEELMNQALMKDKYDQFELELKENYNKLQNTFYSTNIANHLFINSSWFSNKNLHKAIQYYEAAIEMDDNFSIGAHVGKAGCLLKGVQAWIGSTYESNYKALAVQELKMAKLKLQEQLSILYAIVALQQQRQQQQSVEDKEASYNEPELLQQLSIKIDILGMYMNSILQAISVAQKSQRLIHIGVRKYNNDQQLLINEEYYDLEKNTNALNETISEISEITSFLPRIDVDVTFNHLTCNEKSLGQLSKGFKNFVTRAFESRLNENEQCNTLKPSAHKDDINKSEINKNDQALSILSIYKATNSSILKKQDNSIDLKFENISIDSLLEVVDMDVTIKLVDKAIAVKSISKYIKVRFIPEAVRVRLLGKDTCTALHIEAIKNDGTTHYRSFPKDDFRKAIDFIEKQPKDNLYNLIFKNAAELEAQKYQDVELQLELQDLNNTMIKALLAIEDEDEFDTNNNGRMLYCLEIIGLMLHEYNQIMENVKCDYVQSVKESKDERRTSWKLLSEGNIKDDTNNNGFTSHVKFNNVTRLDVINILQHCDELSCTFVLTIRTKNKICLRSKQLFGCNFKNVTLTNLSVKKASQIIQQLRELELEFALIIKNMTLNMAKILLEDSSLEQEHIKLKGVKRLADYFMTQHQQIPCLADLDEYAATGIEYVFEFREACFIPWFHILTVCGLAILQISGGIALTCLTLGWGATVGGGLIVEGVSDLATAVRAFSSRQFSWRSYVSQKAISLLISCATMGITAIKNSAKGTKLAVESAIGEVTESSVTKLIMTESGDQLSNRILSTKSNLMKLAFQDTGLKIGEAMTREALFKMCDNLSRAGFTKLKPYISSRVESKVLEIFENEIDSELLFLVTKMYTIDEVLDQSALSNRIESTVSLILNTNNIIFGDLWTKIGIGLTRGILANSNPKGSLVDMLDIGLRLCITLNGLVEIITVIRKTKEQLKIQLGEYDRKYLNMVGLIKLKTGIILPDKTSGIPTDTIENMYNNDYANKMIRDGNQGDLSSDKIIKDNLQNPNEFIKFMFRLNSACSNKPNYNDFSTTRLSRITKYLSDEITRNIIQVSESQLVGPWTSLAATKFVNAASIKLQRQVLYDGRTTNELIAQEANQLAVNYAQSRIINAVDQRSSSSSSHPMQAKNLPIELQELRTNVCNNRPAGLIEMMHIADKYEIPLKINSDSRNQTISNVTSTSNNVEIVVEYNSNSENRCYSVIQNNIRTTHNTGYEVLQKLTGKTEPELRSEIAADIQIYSRRFNEALAAESLIRDNYQNTAHHHLLQARPDRNPIIYNRKSSIISSIQNISTKASPNILGQIVSGSGQQPIQRGISNLRTQVFGNPTEDSRPDMATRNTTTNNARPTLHDYGEPVGNVVGAKRRGTQVAGRIMHGIQECTNYALLSMNYVMEVHLKFIIWICIGLVLLVVFSYTHV